MTPKALFQGSVLCAAALSAFAAMSAAAPSRHRPVSAAISGQTYEWRPVAIGGGGFITGYETDLSGTTRLARTDVYGGYVWNPARDRWVQLVTTAAMPQSDRRPEVLASGVFALAVAPSDPNRLYMAIAGNVYHSEDGGHSFSRSGGPFPLVFDANSATRMYGPPMAVSPADPNLAFFGTPHDGLLRTADGGRTWSRVASLPNGNDADGPGALLWFARDAKGGYGGKIWALSHGNGMFVSRDGGLSFAPLTNASPLQPRSLKQGEFAADGAFYGVDAESRSIWKYGAGAWQDLSEQPGIERARFASVTIRRDAKKLFVFDEGGDALISNDAGESWRQIPHHAMADAKEPPWLKVNNKSYFATAQARFDPLLPDRLWAAAGTGVYYADVPDDAAEILWKSRARGMEEIVANDVIQPPGHTPLFGGWDFGVHVKPDLNAFSTGYGPKERLLIAVQQMDWSPSNPSFIVTNASDTRLFCCSGDGDSVLAGYSTDGGRTWMKFAHLPVPPGTSPQDPWRMSFGSIAVSADDINNIVWVPSMNRAPYYTINRGVTWNRVRFAGEILPNTGSHARLTLTRKTVAADRVLPGRFYIVHSGDGDNPGLAGLWRSDDGGQNWKKVFSGEISPLSDSAAKLRAVPGKAGHLFFTSAIPSDPRTKLMRSTDGGAHWRAVPGVDRVMDIGFGRAAPGANYPAIYIGGYVGGQYGVWRSTDNAARWTRIGQFPVGSLDLVKAVEGDKDRFGLVYLGFEGSGFAYGRPSSCRPAHYAFGDNRECFGGP